MRNLMIVLACLFIFSCKKDEVKGNSSSEASYQVTITGKWTSTSFSVPSSAHFTYFSGAVHSQPTGLWEEGKMASPGIEAIAETGNQYPLFEEVDGLTAAKKALSQINIPPPDPNTGISRTVYCNSNYPYFSFASMIAPSPDWFIGLSNLNLYRNQQWLTDTTIQLYAYDAGTEDGDAFSYNNPATVPQQTIQLLTPAKATVLANGNTTLAPIAQVRIVKR